ncbi:MAG: glycoside hydrolase family 43 protein [Oscillospiraceae bacterium]|nr:glycoside hydrolase family 43 protein [Oscillospiraceae bacterium]
MNIQNPILPGFYPDPSICRVGGDYYLVTSTFAYFPGVPIFHSTDLGHWRQIGHVLDRPSQLPLEGCETSRGIFAPAIRWHDGLFYMVTTNVSGGGNFYVTAEKPEGPWSEPVWLEDADGIDPTLVFDGGKAYYLGTRDRRGGGRYFGDNEVWLQELDLARGRLTGEKHALWHGALRDAVWAEAPHIYQRGGWYYLMISEGGTCYHHAVTVARSRTLFGPYEGNPGNPILTHRHLGREYPIVNVGHGDLVETQNGGWYMVLLASRPYGGDYRNLGRETFLASVTWGDDWPLVNYGAGVVQDTVPVTGLPASLAEPLNFRDDFDGGKLGFAWLHLRNPRESDYSLDERKGWLRLRAAEGCLGSLDAPVGYCCVRQRHMSFDAETRMEFTPRSDGDRAGLAVYQSHKYHYIFVYTREGGANRLQLLKRENGETAVLADRVMDTPPLWLKVSARGQDYGFRYAAEPGAYTALFEGADGRILCTDAAGGFVGTTVGLYARGSGGCAADFDWFAYNGAGD